MSRPRPLASSSVGTAAGVEGVGADAVDGVGGQHHELAALDGQARPRTCGLPLVVGGGGVASLASARASLCQSRRHEARTAGQVAVVARLAATARSPRRPPARTRPARRRARPRPPPRAAAARPRAARAPDRVEAVVARPQRQGRVVVAGLGRHRLPGLERDVRRVADHDVDGAGEVVERRGHVALAQVDAGAGQVARRPGVGAPRRARRRGPAPRAPRRRRPWRSRPSRCTGRPRPGARARGPASTAQPASSSVSGRGTKTPGPTASSTWRKPATPVRCCSGSRAARGARPGRRTPRRVRGRHLVDERQPARVVPRTWASSSAASCSGLATPASRSRPRPRRAARARPRATRSLLERLEPRREVGVDARAITGSRSPSSTWSRL